MREFEINDIQKGLVAEKESIRRKLVSKWKNRFQTITADEAVLCENTSRTINESTTSVDIAGYNNFAFKLVRRTYGNMIAKELVSVQPMTGPQGKVFYLNPMVTTGTSGDFQNMHEAHYENENFDVSKGAYTILSGRPINITMSNYVSGTSFSIPYSGGVEGLTSLRIVSDVYNDMVLVNGTNGTCTCGIDDGLSFESLPTDGVFDNFPILSGNVSSAFMSIDAGYSGMIKFEFSDVPEVPVSKYSMYFETTRPTRWRFCGSTDDVTWVLLHNVNLPTTYATTYNYFTPTDVSTPYKYYMITGISRNTGTANISEVQLMSGASVELPFTMMPTTWTKDLFSGNLINVIVNRAGGTDVYDRTVSAHTEWRDYTTKEATTNSV